MQKKDRCKIKEFLLRHSVCCAIVGCLFLLGLTYIWFAFGIPRVGFVAPVGEGLQKGDWLGFWGGYLSFVGTTILGIVAVWQNNRANQTNENAILENRAINQQDFENQLKKDQYLAILSGVQHLSTTIYDINKVIVNQLLLHAPHPDRDSKEEIDQIIKIVEELVTQVDFISTLEIDSIIPLYYDTQFPELSAYRFRIKNTLNTTKENLNDYIQQLKDVVDQGNHDIVFKAEVKIPQDAIVAISNLFHQKLYDLSSYEYSNSKEFSNEQSTTNTKAN